MADTQLALRNETDDIALMLSSAIEKGLDAHGIETLSKVYLSMQEIKAERLLNMALQEFQHECPVVAKKTEIDFPTKKGGRFKSKYAEMDDIIEATRELRHKYGFSFTFKREESEKSITVHCEIRHSGGARSSSSFTVPRPTEYLISEQHAYASAVTFCERYAFRAAFGITTGQPDDDGKGFLQSIDAAQAEELTSLIRELKLEQDGAFWAYAKVDHINDLPAADYPRVKQALLAKRRSK